MQIVLHMEKARPVPRSLHLAAAGVAVARLLQDPRSDDEWREAITTWTDGRIRKLARRASGAAWDAVQDVPGVTAELGGVQARAFVPTRVDAVDRRVAKLQLTGTEPAEVGPEHEAVVPGGALVVSISAEPWLSFGKAAAAAGHVAQLSLRVMDVERLHSWKLSGYPVRVEHPSKQRWSALKATAPVVVHDGGFTEVSPGTVTAVGRWA